MYGLEMTHKDRCDVEELTNLDSAILCILKLPTKLSFGAECSLNKKYLLMIGYASSAKLFLLSVLFSCKKEGLGASLFVRSMFGSNHSIH